MRLRTLLVTLPLAAIVLGTAAIWMVGTSLIAVSPYQVPLTGLEAQSLSLRASADQLIAGSYLAGRGQGGVLLLHGIHSDRRQMAQRARWLQSEGYAVMLIDLPGQGASTANTVTFGLREAQGVRVALDELRRRTPGQRIGVIGVSLGAASLVLCRDCGRVDAVVLESMYPTIEEAVTDRLRIRLGAIGGPLSSLLLWQLPLRLNIGLDELRPIDHMAELKAPVLIAAGDLDQHTILNETRRLFAAAAQPKQLWVVNGAAHVDLHVFAPEEYERRIGDFMARHLRP